MPLAPWFHPLRMPPPSNEAAVDPRLSRAEEHNAELARLVHASTAGDAEELVIPEMTYTKKGGGPQSPDSHTRIRGRGNRRRERRCWGRLRLQAARSGP